METLKITFDQYLINNIDGSGYDLNLTTEREKLQFLHDTFIDEQGYNIKRFNYNTKKAFADWLSGLPSCFNIDYENHIILNIGYLFNMINANATEEQEGDFLNNWFKMVANETFKLFDKHGIK
jgi:hypothetical protein